VVVSQTSAGDSVASSALMQKLQQDLQYKNAPVKPVMMKSSLTSTGIEPGLLMSQDSSWIGEGNCVEKEIEPGMHGAVPVEDHSVVHMTVRQLSTVKCMSLPVEK